MALSVVSTALKQSRAGLACAAFFMARTVGVLSFLDA
jgi:hypothetical protein